MKTKTKTKTKTMKKSKDKVVSKKQGSEYKQLHAYMAVQQAQQRRLECNDSSDTKGKGNAYVAELDAMRVLGFVDAGTNTKTWLQNPCTWCWTPGLVGQWNQQCFGTYWDWMQEILTTSKTTDDLENKNNHRAYGFGIVDPDMDTVATGATGATGVDDNLGGVVVKEINTPRTNASVLGISALCYDIEIPSKKEGTSVGVGIKPLCQEDLVRGLELWLRNLVQLKLGWVLMHTWNNKPGANRYRLVIPFREPVVVDTKAWSATYLNAAVELGLDPEYLGILDSNCRGINRCWVAPSRVIVDNKTIRPSIWACEGSGLDYEAFRVGVPDPRSLITSSDIHSVHDSRSGVAAPAPTSRAVLKRFSSEYLEFSHTTHRSKDSVRIAILKGIKSKDTYKLVYRKSSPVTGSMITTGLKRLVGVLDDHGLRSRLSLNDTNLIESRIHVRCPWEHKHSTSSKLSDAMLYVGSGSHGNYLFKCSHGSCNTVSKSGLQVGLHGFKDYASSSGIAEALSSSGTGTRLIGDVDMQKLIESYLMDLQIGFGVFKERSHARIVFINAKPTGFCLSDSSDLLELSELVRVGLGFSSGTNTLRNLGVVLWRLDASARLSRNPKITRTRILVRSQREERLGTDLSDSFTAQVRGVLSQNPVTDWHRTTKWMRIDNGNRKRLPLLGTKTDRPLVRVVIMDCTRTIQRTGKDFAKTHLMACTYRYIKNLGNTNAAKYGDYKSMPFNIIDYTKYITTESMTSDPKYWKSLPWNQHDTRLKMQELITNLHFSRSGCLLLFVRNRRDALIVCSSYGILSSCIIGYDKFAEVI